MSDSIASTAKDLRAKAEDLQAQAQKYFAAADTLDALENGGGQTAPVKRAAKAPKPTDDAKPVRTFICKACGQEKESARGPLPKICKPCREAAEEAEKKG